jgi:hypothetical protein
VSRGRASLEKARVSAEQGRGISSVWTVVWVTGFDKPARLRVNTPQCDGALARRSPVGLPRGRVSNSVTERIYSIAHLAFSFNLVVTSNVWCAALHPERLYRSVHICPWSPSLRHRGSVRRCTSCDGFCIDIKAILSSSKPEGWSSCCRCSAVVAASVSGGRHEDLLASTHGD